MELQDPMVAFSIFAIISLTQSCQVLSIQEGLHSVKELLCTFMIGFAIATGVSLFILPLTSRKNVFGGFRAYPTAITKVLESFKAYLDSLRQSSDSGSDNQTTDTSQTILDRQVTENSKTAAVTAALQSLQGLHDKLHAELFYASREVAWGKLDATDIKVIIAHLRPILLSVAGIVMSTPLIDKSTSGKTLSGSLLGGSDLGTGQSRPMSCFWKRYLESLDQNITTVTELANLGMQHSFTVLGVLSKKVASANNDLEANPNAIKPGQRDFADHLKVRIKHFSSRHGCTENLFTTSCSQRPPSYRCKCDETTCSSPTKEELLVALSLENLEDTALAAVHDLVNLAEQMEQAGKMQRARLILPGAAQLIAWLSFNTLYSGTTSQNHDSVEEEPDDPDARHLEELSDPEHLPASSTWQRLGNRLRSLSHMMSSDQSVFGFRAACASFTVGILAYLHQTQHFFTEQRLVWAMIVVVLGMSPSTGASVFSFIWRLIGTVVALVLSLVVYYIADGKTAGVIVFLYIANCFMVRQKCHHCIRNLQNLLAILLHQVPAYSRTGDHLNCHIKPYSRLRASGIEMKWTRSEQFSEHILGQKARHRRVNLYRSTLLPNLPFWTLQASHCSCWMSHLLLLDHLPISHLDFLTSTKAPWTQSLQFGAVLRLHAHNDRHLDGRRTERRSTPLNIAQPPKRPESSVCRTNVNAPSAAETDSLHKV